MRITGGKYKGRVFSPPKVDGLRPTMERVRQAVFSTLESLGAVSGKSVLDLYAGSGAFGIEALSRGADSCLFVEKNRVLVDFVQSVFNKLSVSGGSARVTRGVLPSAIESLAGGFDLVFCDPPYKEITEELLRALKSPGLLSEGGVLVLESSARDASPESLVRGSPALRLLRERRYGDTSIRIYCNDVGNDISENGN